MSNQTDRFTLLVTVQIKPGLEDEYLRIVHPVLDAMRRESTFVHTTLLRAADDPGLFMLYETWLGREQFFTVQRHRPYRAEHEARLPALLRAPRTMTVLQMLRSDSAESA